MVRLKEPSDLAAGVSRVHSNGPKYSLPALAGFVTDPRLLG
jgi:hypothetical protein